MCDELTMAIHKCSLFQILCCTTNSQI